MSDCGANTNDDEGEERRKREGAKGVGGSKYWRDSLGC